MKGKWSRFLALASIGSLFALTSNAGCGSSSGGSGFNGSNGSSGGSSGAGSSSGNSGGSSGTCLTCGDGGSGSGGDGSTIVCPQGLQCNVQCSGGTTTTISGKVYDPAKKNPLYNVAVYVPQAPLQPLPQGVLTGADACSCAALFKSGAVVSAATGVDGSFKLQNAPVGSAVPLVLQVGKWRKLVTINVKSCQDNPQADKSLALPGTIAAGDTNDNMPDIAVSTGGADTLECLMTRIGVPTSEYVAGAGGTGHVHVYAGGDPTGMSAGGGVETPGWSGTGTAPQSHTALWDSVQHLMPYDITLLSCEGGETFDANPAVLEQYLNAGGRAFGSHFHYAWFSGPFPAATPPGSGQSYSAPADWGNNLASWHLDMSGASDPMGGIIDQTLNGSNQPFVKGQMLYTWLGLNNALGNTNPPITQAIPMHDLPIAQPRYNANVTAANKPSQPWITSDTDGIAGATMYFSFDTPVNAMAPPDGGAPNYCGRAVFSDLHVGGLSADTPSPPMGCSQANLSPQEKALEFMLFDLSSCVIPDTVPPSDAGVPVQ
jgi:hypothetical protein